MGLKRATTGTVFFSLLFSLTTQSLFAATLHVGTDSQYGNIGNAARDAEPGDTILIHSGTYSGDQWMSNLQGTADSWIYIIGEEFGSVQFSGGVGAWILTDPAYLHIENIVFTDQTHNGMNLHDGDSYETPAHHIRFNSCRWQNLVGGGNYDLLKLSGLDDFEITNCEFIDGSNGSGIDMVGCHRGIVENCIFRNIPGGAVQTKGGSSDIRIAGNLFDNYGIRGVNAGGSTDLEYFRPRDAASQAERIAIHANIFVGGVAAIAFAGAIHSEAVNNTIVNPSSFVVRILQEQTENGRFALCGDNSFINNLVYMNSRLWEMVNIGPDTRPSSCNFSNNLWYTESDPDHRPNFPGHEPNAVFGLDPMFESCAGLDYCVSPDGPACRGGMAVEQPLTDYFGEPFASSPTIGAVEAEELSTPTVNRTSATLPKGMIHTRTEATVYTALGRRVFEAGTSRSGGAQILLRKHGSSVEKDRSTTRGFHHDTRKQTESTGDTKM